MTWSSALDSDYGAPISSAVELEAEVDVEAGGGAVGKRTTRSTLLAGDAAGTTSSSGHQRGLSGVFTRKWTKAVATYDCNTLSGNITFV